jgi:hypothetical protein
VIVLDAGNIVEDGTYDELMRVPNGRLKTMMDEFGGVESPTTEGGMKNEKGSTESSSAQPQTTLTKSDEKPPVTDVSTSIQTTKEDSKEKETQPLSEKELQDKAKLITVEERQVGAVSFRTLAIYFRLGGGLKMAALIIGGALVAQISRILTDSWYVEFPTARIWFPFRFC